MSAILAAVVVGGAAITSTVIAGKQQKKASKRAIEAQESAEQRATRQAEETKAAARSEQEKARDMVNKNLASSYEEALGVVRSEAAKTIPTLGELPEAQKLKGTLEERLAGRGVGFREDFLDAATAPYAEARREGFKRYEAPAISAAASARGLGRSTIPVAQIGLAAQQAERDIEQRVADVSLMNEQQMRQEINTALEQYKQFTGAELASQQQAAQYQRTGQFALADMISQQANNLAQIELQIASNLSNIEMQVGTNISGMQFQSGSILANLIQTQGMQAAANTMKMGEIVGSTALGFTKAKIAADANKIAQQNVDTQNKILSEMLGAQVNVAQ